jgi:hypothetical protein
MTYKSLELLQFCFKNMGLFSMLLVLSEQAGEVWEEGSGCGWAVRSIKIQMSASPSICYQGC